MQHDGTGQRWRLFKAYRLGTFLLQRMTRPGPEVDPLQDNARRPRVLGRVGRGCTSGCLGLRPPGRSDQGAWAAFGTVIPLGRGLRPELQSRLIVIDGGWHTLAPTETGRYTSRVSPYGTARKSEPEVVQSLARASI